MNRFDAAWRLCLLLCLTTLAPAGWSLAGGPGQDVLVFSRQDWIWTCDGDGRSVRKVCPGVMPGVAPDSRSIVFFRSSQDSTSPDFMDLWVHAEGRETRVAGSMLPGSSPVWHPDQGLIAFLVRDDDARTGVMTVELATGKKRVLFSEKKNGTGFLCSIASSADVRLVVHDMQFAYWLDWGGRVVDKVALVDIMGDAALQVTSADRFVPCPTDPSLLVFSHSVPGTAVFERIMHEPNSALSLHDRWTGRGKNMRITPVEITAFDPVWSADGKRIYFIGYRDTQAADHDLFRILRVERFGSGLRAVTMGEGVSVSGR